MPVVGAARRHPDVFVSLDAASTRAGSASSAPLLGPRRHLGRGRPPRQQPRLRRRPAGRPGRRRPPWSWSPTCSTSLGVDPGPAAGHLPVRRAWRPTPGPSGSATPGPSTHELAARLLATGIDHAAISRRLFDTAPFGWLGLLSVVDRPRRPGARRRRRPGLDLVEHRRGGRARAGRRAARGAWSTSSGRPRRPTSPACSRGRTTAPGRCRCARAAAPTSPAVAHGAGRRRAPAGRRLHLAPRPRGDDRGPAAASSPLRRRPRGHPPRRELAPSVLALALPALVVLAAEPLYLLVDTAVVGNLGTVAAGRARRRRWAAGLGRRAAELPRLRHDGPGRPPGRRRGPGRRGRRGRAGHLARAGPRAARRARLFQVARRAADPAAGRRGRTGRRGGGAVAAGRRPRRCRCCWSRWPATAGCAGSQELRRPVRYVLAGSLVSLVLCPLLVLPGRAGPGRLRRRQRRRAGGDRRPVPAARWRGEGVALAAPVAGRARRQLVIGRDLLLRAVVLQASFLRGRRRWWPAPAPPSSAPTRSRCSCASSWPWCSTPTRSPRRPWSGQRARRRPAGPRPAATARRVARWGLGTGVVVGGRCCWPRGRCCSRCSPTTRPCSPRPAVVWWFLAAMQPLAGVVFALDGVLMGAGDVGYLRTVTIGSARGRVPAAVAARRCRWAGGWPGCGPG